MIVARQQAIDICNEIEAKLAPIGYHCGLTGSTLYRGYSEKDIDIIIYPHQVSSELPMQVVLDAIGAQTDMYPSTSNYEPSKIVPSTTDKLVVVSDYNGIRIDFFFLK
jgi:hypothetical protein